MKRILIAAVALLLAGCLDNQNSSTAPSGVPVDVQIPPQVVVAVLDTAINPYHAHFQRGASLSDEQLARFADAETGALPERLALSIGGEYDERREVDTPIWENITAGQLYYFEGTNVLGISFDGNIIDGGSHGTATSGAVLDANPDAIVVLVQGFGGPGEPWAAAQPWIDLMSESYGPLGSPPAWLVAGSSTASANKVKWEAGGIPVGASDNSPALAPVDSTAGPPWVVGVAGDHDNGCREPMSGNLPDFTADFTQYLPVDRTIDEYGNTSGTSFATPFTAGVFSKAIQEVRGAWSHQGGILDGTLAISPTGERLSNVDVREAFNRTARYFSQESCGGGVPVNEAAPWTQQGWGHIGREIIANTVQHLLGAHQAPEKPEQARLFMGAVHEERKATWALLP